MSSTAGNPLSLRAFWSLRYAAGGSPLTQIVSQRIGAIFAWLACSTRLSPSAVTCLGLGTFVIGAVLYGSLPAGLGPTLCCFAIFQLGYGLDCADGQLARATQATSAFGAWLDVACDYLRNILLALALIQHLIVLGFSLATSLAAGGLMLSGTVVKLHTVSALREGPPLPGSPTGAIRTLGKTLLDTVTHLSALALFRDVPLLLITYAVATGLGYATLAGAQARRRLR